MAVPKLVRDIMTRELTTLAHDARLLDAAWLTRPRGLRRVPVVNGDKLVGVLSDRDVQRAAPSIFGKMTPEEYNRIFETTPLAKVMAKEPVTVTPATPVTEVVKMMYERKFGSVPVVEGEKLVGIVTTTDLLGLLSKLLGT